MATWKFLVAVLGGTVILQVAVAWLVKSIITHFLSKSVESYRVGLQADMNKQIERLRHELHIVAAEREIQYKVLQEKLAEVVGTTFEKLFLAYRALRSYVAEIEYEWEPSKQDKREEFREALGQFHAYFMPRQIYFPASTSTKIKELTLAMSMAGREMRRADDLEAAGKSPSPAVDHWENAIKVIDERAEPLFEELREELQKIIGASR